MSTKLSLQTLSALGDKVAVPKYDRADLKAGIVHFGIGNFHRAHQAVYLHELFDQGRDLDFAIVGAGVLPSDEAMKSRLAAQDYLCTVVEQDRNRNSAAVTGVLVDFLSPDDPATTIAKLADPAIRIVSLTITEGGYFINPATGVFDPAHPAMAEDGKNPNAPKTVFGIIVAGIKARKEAGTQAFTVMSCDNIPGNGEVTRAAVCGLAKLSDPALAEWIEANVAFPNAMVDRITPATNPGQIEFLRSEFGVEDAAPVFCEGFRQWVVEDHFPAGRPAFEAVGAQFVPDVAPYEHMKIRILNGGHAAIAYPAALMDIELVHEAMEEPIIDRFLEKLELGEIVPIVPPVPETNLNDYFGIIRSRFANPKVRDTIPRLALDGSNRQPKFILPSTRDRLAQGLDVVGLALVSALWCRYLEGTSDSGKPIEIMDANRERLHAAALAARDNPLEFLKLDDIFGDVAQSELFQRRFTTALNSLHEKGARATLEAYLADTLG
ncbi:mannitol dehydrogenase family protein [Aureimonas leprariae]|uniref:Mannitol dehydrogenase family protein n=1 Tax=Plantimonas leprariae TaxID=2615207 RepID=A0A7V7PN65_9HYPH|nr:mannitol dehydrogenase family protein [Aureimonas leprariae]KAB0678806.1 mannitol dehydrogenase family protein [Aureimonas leprariae]